MTNVSVWSPHGVCRRKLYVSVDPKMPHWEQLVSSLSIESHEVLEFIRSTGVANHRLPAATERSALARKIVKNNDLWSLDFNLPNKIFRYLFLPSTNFEFEWFRHSNGDSSAITNIHVHQRFVQWKNSYPQCLFQTFVTNQLTCSICLFGNILHRSIPGLRFFPYS